MMRECRVLATAIMFLTRIPVGQWGSGDPADLAASTKYFPLIGILIGILVSIVFIFANLFWNSDIAITFALLAGVLLTGGFHEDGLADVADSAGAWTPEKKLEVMRDSRVGTYGALALVFMVLIKFLSLSAIADTRSTMVLAATFVLAHVLARWSTLPLIWLTPYAREDSSNKVFAEGVTRKRLIFGSFITLAVMFICSIALGSGVVLAFAMMLVVVWLSRLWFIRSVGGITGDCLGAANQIVEVFVYLCVAGMLLR